MSVVIDLRWGSSSIKLGGKLAGSSDPKLMRTLRLIRAVAAFLAALGIAIIVIWFVIRVPLF